MKKLISLVLAILTLTAVLYAPFSAITVNNDDIVILYTNDVHCGIDVNLGYEGLKLFLREMKAQYKNALMVDAGDAIQGMPVGTLSKGEDIISLMNTVGYDAATVGNHEFDYTVPQLLKCAEELSCGYICCNFIDNRTGETVFRPYEIFERAGKKIALVGVVTPETFGSTTPAYFIDDQGNHIYSFCEEKGELYRVVQENVDSAKADGADYVILLAHLGELDIGNGWTSMDVVAHTDGVDAVIDGHSHQVTERMVVQDKNGKDVPITQTGTKMQYLGKMTITQNGRISTELIGTVSEPSEEFGFDPDSYREVRDNVWGDAAISDMIQEIEKKNDEEMNIRIGETAFDLCDSDPVTGLRLVRNSETNLGDFLTDAVRDLLETDTAILNGGGIRAGIPAGDITYKSILTVFPFQNQICAAKVTGQQILDYLEYASMAYPVELGEFAHVSGIRYSIDRSIESSVKVDEYQNFISVDGEYRVKNVQVNGEALDLQKIYTVASINYLLENGGDGNIFSGKSDVYIKDRGIDLDLMVEYITDNLNGTIPEIYRNPYGQGRILIIDRTRLLGDTDSDNAVTVLDASYIQKWRAKIPIPFEIDKLVSDADKDGYVTVIDATCIQKWLAGLPANDKIGKPITS